MKLTYVRRQFLAALIAHGPFKNPPKGVDFPNDVVLGQMESAGLIAARPVGRPRSLHGTPVLTQRREFRITDRGRAEYAAQAVL